MCSLNYIHNIDVFASMYYPSALILGGYLGLSLPVFNEDSLPIILLIGRCMLLLPEWILPALLLLVGCIWQQYHFFSHRSYAECLQPAIAHDHYCSMVITSVPAKAFTQSFKAWPFSCTFPHSFSQYPFSLSTSIGPLSYHIGDTILVPMNTARPRNMLYPLSSRPLFFYAQGSMPRLFIKNIQPMPRTLKGLQIFARYYALRGDFIKFFQHTYGQHHSSYSVVMAILFGEQQLLSDTSWFMLKTTSTAHLVAISGLHIQILANLFGQLLLPFCSYFNPSYPKRSSQYIVTIMLFFYYLISGLSYSCQRACLMYAYQTFCMRHYKPYRAVDALFFSAAIAFILHPNALFSTGFILSYGMVFVLLSIGYFQPNASWYYHPLLVYAGGLPFTYAFWARFCLVAPLANTIAIPFIGYLILPCALLCVASMLLSSTLFAYCISLLDLLWNLFTRFLLFLSYLDPGI